MPYIAKVLLTLIMSLVATSYVAPTNAQDRVAGNAAALFPGYGGGLRTGPQSETPPAAEVFAGSKLIGYAFSTRAVTQSVGYSGRPLDILVGLGIDGTIKGTRLVAQEEPILVIGIRPQDLEAYVDGLAGLDIRLRPSDQKRAPGVPDHIVGATVSSTVIKDAVLRSARTVALARGMLGTRSSRPAIDRASFSPKTWNELLADASIARRSVRMSEVAHVLSPATESNGLFIELYATLLSPSMIGQNLLGTREYERVMAQLPLDGHAILIEIGRAHV